MIKVGIVGGTGYAGVELLRLLALHPEVELTVITSRSEEGVHVADMYPNLRGHLDLRFSAPGITSLAGCDLVFFATPHGVAMEMAPQLLEQGTRIVDLGADFRIQDLAVWSQWYNLQHSCPDVAAEAVYGLPEVNREQIKTARLIANPGCYPTAAQLGYLPLLENGLVETDHLVADCISAASGAGRGANVHTLLCEASESIRAYGVAGHRHLPEIRQGLEHMVGHQVGLTFVPHLAPMIRGIHATLYSQLNAKGRELSEAQLQGVFEQRFADEPFVDVMPQGSLPETRTVKGSNQCRMAIYRPQGGDTLVVLSVIDNLVKGAAGQAVQNMNIMFGFDEQAGLNIIGLLP